MDRCLLLALLLLLPSLALAAPKKGRGKVEVPLDIGVGPAAHLLTGPVFREQPVLGGLAFSAEAVLDNATLRKLKRRIPAQYRKQVLQMDELRISHALVPRTLWISPRGVGGATVGMYGLQLRPVAVGMPLIKSGARLSVDAGLVLSYFYLHGDNLPGDTHFLRPGVDPRIVLEVPLSKRVLVSVGWASQLYIPQTVGGGVFQVGPLDASVWHVGQGFLKVHHRFPLRVSRQ